MRKVLAFGASLFLSSPVPLHSVDWLPAPRVAATTLAPDSVPANLLIEAKVRGTRAYLPVKINGHPATLLIFLGNDDALSLDHSRLAQLGITLTDSLSLDSLTIGTAVERHVPISDNGFFSYTKFTMTPEFPELPPLVGYIGTNVLAHYDVLFDELAHRVQLYRAPAGKKWLPVGLRAKDCIPMIPIAHQLTGIPVHTNGQTIPGILENFYDNNPAWLDSAALNRMGIRLGSPQLHVINQSAIVTDVHLTVGKYPLNDAVLGASNVFGVMGNAGIPDTTSLALLRLSQFRNYILFLSNTSGRVCLSTERSIAGPSSN